MVVLSLFDGVSCGRLALERAGVPIMKYYASEVDTTAIGVAKTHYPDTVYLGDVRSVTQATLPPPPQRLICLLAAHPVKGSVSQAIS